ncbi:MAG: FeoA family protein [Bacillota bacterium]
MTVKTLMEMKKEQTAKIKEIHCSDIVSKRLINMGVTKGVKIRYLGNAPLGDPLLIEARGVYIAIRKSVCEQIIVKDINAKTL